LRHRPHGGAKPFVHAPRMARVSYIVIDVVREGIHCKEALDGFCRIAFVLASIHSQGIIIMKRIILTGILSLGVMSSACALELEVTNKSKAAIHHLYLSASSQKNWGPDQLGSGSNDTVEPGSKFTLHGIEAGEYDVKIATQDGTECEVDNADFSESKEWVITEHMLDKCGG
jgi:hypothetical protein